jgi:23S rRNA pseudouridine955/2504/2580 synthase
LVHRLDKDTSGLIIVAKTKEAARVFSALFAGGAGMPKKDRPITKQYLGVCFGIPKAEQPDRHSGVISHTLDVRGKQKESETFYRLLSSGSAGEIPCSLLELELITGRMHQIRRHLAQTGYPLLGDDKYGDFPLNKKLRKSLGLKHLLLHASRLIIPPLPDLIPDGLDISAALPEYFCVYQCQRR